jgi:triacylglycerol lipase
MSSLPDQIRKIIPSLGQNAAPENSAKIRELYAPMLAGVRNGVSSRLDAAYGDHARQKLDVYWKEGGTGKPVFVYIPGGGFVGGDKRSDDLYYGNIGACAAHDGMVCVIANYRLAPEAKWPLASKDIESAVNWTKAHAKEFGGDPEKIVIMGHSAGAAHVATYLFDPDIKGELHVKGGLLSSGPYTMPKGPKPPNFVAYYGDDDSVADRRSALNYVKDSKLPICISVAEYDPPNLITPAFEMAKALVARSNTCPSIRCAEGHNHFSTVSSMGTSDDDFARFTLGFVRQCVGG